MLARSIVGPSTVAAAVRIARATAVLGLALAVVPVGGNWHAAHAAETSIEGAWAGGGRMVLASGDAERATCRASFRRRSASSFSVSAVCATPSARVAQTAVVRRVGDNQFSGAFHNREYDVSGAMHLTARGNRMSVWLSGGGATGHLELHR
jgi:hypothetical protein